MNNKIQIHLNDTVKISNFLKLARSFNSDIDVITDRIYLDAKSILGLYSIDLSQPIYVRIISDNEVECEKFSAAMDEFQ